MATLHYGVAAYLPRIVNFLLLPIYAIFLPPEEMGIVEICMAVQVLIQAVSRLGLPGAFARYYFDNRDPEGLKDLITTTALAVLLSTTAVSLLFWLIAPYVFATYLPKVPFSPYVELAIIAGALGFATELQARVLQVQENSKLAAGINVGLSLLGTAGKFLFVVGLQMKAIGVLYADIVVVVVGFGIAVYRHRGDLTGRIRWDLLRPCLAYGVPLLPHKLGAWLAQFAAQWVMGTLGALAAMGQLGIANRVVMPLRLATGSFATAYPPVYFGWRADLSEQEALTESRKVSRAALSLMAVGGLGATIFGAWVIRHLLTDAYRAGAVAVGGLAAAIVIRFIYNMLGQELLYAKRTAPTSLIFFVGSITNIGVTAWLVPKHGVVGAAYGQIAGDTVSVFITTLLARQTFPLSVAPRAFFVVVVGAVMCAGLPVILPAGSAAFEFALGTGAWLIGTLVLLIVAGVRPAMVRELVSLIRNRKKKKKTKEAT